jgi:hypothetical protein
MKSTGGFSFGTSSRDTVNRQYVSPACDRAQLKSRGGNYSPGHVYNPVNESSFAKSTFLKNQGSMIFGTSKRMIEQRPRSPGPGTYESRGAVGSQVISTRPSSAMPSFGRTDRDQASRVFITSRHEKALIGKNSPGPGAYESALDGVGKSAVFNNTPSWGMGTQEKFLSQNIELRRKGQTPGAGMYESQVRGVLNTVQCERLGRGVGEGAGAWEECAPLSQVAPLPWPRGTSAPPPFPLPTFL